MTASEADTIIGGLTAAFPNARLEDDTPDVWRKHLAPLDFDVADRAVGQCILNVKFFPTVAEFREFYRLERHNTRPPQPEVVSDSSGIPVWVHVWRWRSAQTMTARQAARESHRPVEERRPVQMRDFPQIVGVGRPSPSGAYSWEEYHQLERDWIAAGSPGSARSASRVPETSDAAQ